MGRMVEGGGFWTSERVGVGVEGEWVDWSGCMGRGAASGGRIGSAIGDWEW